MFKIPYNSCSGVPPGGLIFFDVHNTVLKVSEGSTSFTFLKFLPISGFSTTASGTPYSSSACGPCVFTCLRGLGGPWGSAQDYK